jgi:hypothetical protein
VDADLSGGPFIFNPHIPDRIDNHFRFSGVHAQNYHIYTPPVNNAKVLVWGCQHWIADFPHANFAYDYSFKHGEAGDLILECWITPFDYAPYAGFNEARVSELQENQLIGLAWSILDFDGGKRDGHFNLAHDVRMVKNASYLCPFRLMPLEPVHLKHLQADWSFKVMNMQERKVAFIDESVGDITDWLWEFGDGQSSTERNPIHVYEEPGIYYVVTLTVKSENQISKRSRYWEVMIK